MRLINTTTLRMEEFYLDVPPYAALSHTWTFEELTLEDMLDPERAMQKAGFEKLAACSSLARRDCLDYLWMDTCCINKASSAELTEAINSMFDWYQGATVCYVCLVDVIHDSGFEQARWFTRGWVLQELLAPNNLQFYSGDWKFLGTRYQLASQIAGITGIDRHILERNHKPSQAPLETHQLDGEICQECGIVSAIKPLLKQEELTRVEDIAYSLLGIFDVNIPLLYGEGKNSFARLQEEIVKGSNDHSIIAFRSLTPTLDISKDALVHGPVLAPFPALFQDSIKPDWALSDITSKMNYLDGDLTIDMLICSPLDSPFGDCFDHYIGILDCVLGDDLLSRPAILLRKINNSQKFYRIGNSLLFQIRPDKPDVVLPIFPENTPETIVEDYIVTFNPGDARRARVTITSPKPEVERQVWKMPPLRLKYEHAWESVHETGYNITRTVPDRVGDYIMPLQNSKSIGLVALESPSTVPILIIWGFSPAYPVEPWCRILPLTEVRHARLDGIIEKVRSNDVRVRPRLEPLAELKSRVDTRRCGIGNNYEITAKISITTFLDRHAIQMEIQIGKLE